MTNDEEQGSNISLNVPISVLGLALVAGLAALAFLMNSGPDSSSESTASAVTRSARGGLRKVGLLGLASAIENDATRKVVVAALRAMAKRS